MGLGSLLSTEVAAAGPAAPLVATVCPCLSADGGPSLEEGVLAGSLGTGVRDRLCSLSPPAAMEGRREAAPTACAGGSPGSQAGLQHLFPEPCEVLAGGCRPAGPGEGVTWGSRHSVSQVDGTPGILMANPRPRWFPLWADWRLNCVCLSPTRATAAARSEREAAAWRGS